jgi:hypothetical protein
MEVAFPKTRIIIGILFAGYMFYVMVLRRSALDL